MFKMQKVPTKFQIGIKKWQKLQKVGKTCKSFKIQKKRCQSNKKLKIKVEKQGKNAKVSEYREKDAKATKRLTRTDV